MSGSHIQSGTAKQRSAQERTSRPNPPADLRGVVAQAFQVAQVIEKIVRESRGRQFSVTFDTLVLPGRLLSGSVTFTDGQSAAWFVDRDGRFGMSSQRQDYRPPQTDLELLKAELEVKLQEIGISSFADKSESEQSGSHKLKRLSIRSLPGGERTLGEPLCIETLGGVSSHLIEAGVRLPCCFSEIFSTATENQPGVEIHILQGERYLAKDNRSIGKFYLTEIPPAPRGVPRIEVRFNVDWDGNLEVMAVNLDTGNSQKIIIRD